MENKHNLLEFIIKTAGSIKHSLIITFFGYSYRCKHEPSCSRKLLASISTRGTIAEFFKAFSQFINCR